MSPTLKRIYKQISQNTGLSMEMVEEIVRSQFQFVKDIMASGEKNDPESFKTINVTHLGKFAIREFKVMEYYKKSLEDDNRGEGTE
jgi:nucleoid DNA-binding protein